MSASDQYEQWNRQRRELARLLLEVRETAAVVGDPELADDAGAAKLADDLGQAHERLLRDTFRIMLLGVFTAGKSTLINAMLGEEVLPKSINPSTAFATLVQWDEKQRAELYRRTPDGGEEKHDKTIEEYQEYVKLKLGKNGNSRQENDYHRAVVYLPRPLLGNRVELVEHGGGGREPGTGARHSGAAPRCQRGHLRNPLTSGPDPTRGRKVPGAGEGRRSLPRLRRG